MLVVAAVALTGCDSGDGDSSPSVNVSGTWRGSSVGEDPANSDSSITMILAQDGSALTGTVDGVSLSGSVSGNSLSATFLGGENDVITLEGTVDGNTMSGTWVSTTDEKGTWSATRS
jgi:hypothetical protein